MQEFFHEQYQYISIYIFVHKNMYMLTQISCCVMEFSGIHENMKNVAVSTLAKRKPDIQGGPLLVVKGVIIPINGLTNE